MRVRQISKPQVRKNRFRHIHHNVAGRIPRRENAKLGFPLRINRAFQKSDARMASTGIRQYQQRFAADVPRCAAILQMELRGGGPFVRGQTRSGRDFLRREAVKHNHILQPVAQFRVVSGTPRVVTAICPSRDRVQQNYGCKEDSLLKTHSGRFARATTAPGDSSASHPAVWPGTRRVSNPDKPSKAARLA